MLEGGAPYSGCLGDCGGDIVDACGDCMAFCVNYVMTNYGYTEEEANGWCTSTPDSGYGCADSCADGSPSLADLELQMAEKTRQIYELKMLRSENVLNRRSPINSVNPPTIVNVAGDVIYSPTDSRVISYEINAYCDACLDGGAWSATYTSSTTEFLVYGFDEGVEACAEVRALSSNTNTVSAWSETACAAAGCGPDCVAGDANGDGNVNVSDIVLLVGAILNNGGSTDGVDCGDMDGGGVINVSDIVAIINIILNPMSDTSNATEAKLNIGTDVSIIADGQISAIQMVLSHDSDFSIELTQDAWVADYATSDNKTTLIVVMPGGEYLFTPNGEFTIEETIVLNSENEIDVTSSALPAEFSVSDAYPNPFNPVTALNINLPEEGLVNVNVYNVAGQMVDAVYSNSLIAGTHSISWDASNLPSGVYLIRTEAGKNISTQKVMLLK
tara:strand:- start:258 stop:1589 length:1332 start_codon:yes stop_codon:yes gene_type:complete